MRKETREKEGKKGEGKKKGKGSSAVPRRFRTRYVTGVYFPPQCAQPERKMGKKEGEGRGKKKDSPIVRGRRDRRAQRIAEPVTAITGKGEAPGGGGGGKKKGGKKGKKKRKKPNPHCSQLPLNARC